MKKIKKEFSKYEIPKTNKLEKILYFIGDTFYKCINGCYYSFDFTDDKKIISTNESGNKLVFFELDENNHICNIQKDIQNWFDFTEVLNIEIDYKDWETYLLQ